MTNPSDIHKQLTEAARESARSLESSVDRLAPGIVTAARAMADSISSGGRVLVCGNGGSAADAQHLAAELVGRFLLERRPYSAVALSTDTSTITSVANDYGFDAVFERQTLALGRVGDCLVAISTSGNSPNVLRAIAAAATIGMKTIGVTGKGGGKMAALVDILLDADSSHTPTIQETHSFIVHALCGLVEQMLADN